MSENNNWKNWNFDKNVKNGVVVVSTEGYFNKDLGEALKEITDQEIKGGHKNFLINLDQSKIVNSIGASILIEIIEELDFKSFKLSYLFKPKTFSYPLLT